MDNYEAIRDLVEADGCFKLVRLEWLYLDPAEDSSRNPARIYAAVLKGRHECEEGFLGVVLPLSDKCINEDPEMVARDILSRAQEAARARILS